jgi:hypothetical protein
MEVFVQGFFCICTRVAGRNCHVHTWVEIKHNITCTRVAGGQWEQSHTYIGCKWT